jgi:bacterioferritin (cytochrome b1)
MMKHVDRAALFAAEIADELGHAELLADAIVVLGGTPTVTPALVPVAEGAAAMLRCVLEAEGSALARYVARRRQAEALGEHGLAVALDAVIADAARHRDELRLVLAGWADAAAADGIAEGRVHDASNDSFPASDPPSWSGMRLGPPRTGR